MMDHHDFCIEINVEHIGQMWESKVNLKTNLKNLLRMGEILLSRTKSLEIQFNKCMNKFSSSFFSNHLDHFHHEVTDSEKEANHHGLDNRKRTPDISPN